MTALGTLAAIAERSGGRVIGDGSIEVERLVAIDDADAGALTFATDANYLRAALASRARAVLTDEGLVDAARTYSKPIVAVPSTRLAMAALLAALEPPRPRGPFRHPTAAVDAAAVLAADVYVGALAVVGAGAEIGAGTVLGAGAIVGADARLGRDCTLHPRAYVADRCILGDRVVLQAGAVVGSDGFGYAFLDGQLRKIPQIGIVQLGDDVEIGANTCIDRAQTGVTSIGEGTKIDNLCQIGHNSRIGKHTALAAMNGLAGTTTLGDYVQVGGQSGFGGHLTVGSRVKVAGGSHVWGDVPDGMTVSGQPAQRHRDELRLQAYVRRLPKLYERVEALERLREREPSRE
jgi:UDP-3-O-[3-hydroxymyristoyl] glucosamine N-acyltransferase